MRTNKLFIMCFITLFSIKTNCNSQNVIDPPSLLRGAYSTLSKADTNNIGKGNANKFILGWNWGSPGKKLDEALKINTYHGFDFDQTKTSDLNNIKDSIMYFQYLHDLIVSRAWDVPFTALSHFINSTIIVDSIDSFKPRPYDKTGAIFGLLNCEPTLFS